MNRSTFAVVALLATLFAAPVVAQNPPAQGDVLAELKARMKTRYPLLEATRDAGKIGETREGVVKLVKATSAGDAVDPKDPAKGTFAELVAAENKDRALLYEALAKELKITAAEVAKQNGLRNLDKARPEHLVEIKGEWVQRKSVRTVTGNDKK